MHLEQIAIHFRLPIKGGAWGLQRFDDVTGVIKTDIFR